MKCHDLQHTGKSPYSTAQNPPNVEKWEYETGGWIEDSPIIASDGTIYVTAESLYAINPNGTLKWRYNTVDTIFSAPAISEDNTIYITSYNEYLRAINANGTSRWRFDAQSPLTSSPAIANDGTIFFGAMGPGDTGRIFAINPNGTEKWHYNTGYYVFADPAIGTDGTIYVPSGDSYLYALYPNGTLEWRFQTNGQIHAHPSIAPDGTIYIESFDDFLYAVNPNGTMKWKYNTGFGASSCASIDTDGTIYVGTDKLYAINSNGTTKWTFNLGTDRWIGDSCPAISSDGTIYIGAWIGDDKGGEIIVIDHTGNEIWRKNIAHYHVDSSPCIGSDGTVYIGSSSDTETNFNSNLYAFGLGPLIAHAHGPYQGSMGIPLQFTGTAYGGFPPYTYHWDFGNGNTSSLQNPTNTYSMNGNFTVIFTVTDSTGNQTSDTTTATITYGRPVVTIVRPNHGVYLFNRKILSNINTISIGPITVLVDAYQIPFGISKVEFYVNHHKRATDTTPPYQWTWVFPLFGYDNLLEVTAYDTKGNSTTVWISVQKYL
jgi:outer membrane protein assembly factor BamB